jgi:hypothetical protein
MQKTILNQIFLLISLIPCCNMLNAMEKQTQKTTTATSTTVHRHALRSKGNNNLFHNSNLITRANASPKIARAKTAPKKSLKSLPLPSSPIKRKNLEDHKKQNLVVVDVFSPATEESSSSSSFSSSEETDNSSIDVFSGQKEYSSLLTKYQPSEGLSFEDLFMDVQTSTKDFSLDDFALQASLQDFLFDQIQ